MIVKVRKILGIVLALVIICGAAALFITNKILDDNLDALAESIKIVNVDGNKNTAPDRYVRDEFRKETVSDF